MRLPPPTTPEVKGSLARLLGGWEQAADAHDVAIRRAIEDAIRLQESDPDAANDPRDAKVLALLKSALKAQQADEAGE